MFDVSCLFVNCPLASFLKNFIVDLLIFMFFVFSIISHILMKKRKIFIDKSQYFYNLNFVNINLEMGSLKQIHIY
jgi:hypothetical protein